MEGLRFDGLFRRQCRHVGCGFWLWWLVGVAGFVGAFLN